MNYIDIILSLILFYGLFKGFTRGLIIEAASLLSIIIGILGALTFTPIMENLLSYFFSDEKLPSSIILFTASLILIVLGINFFAKNLTKFIKLVSLGGINKVLGGIFGVSKYVLLISILFVFVDQFSFMFEFFESNFLEESVMFESLKNVGYYIIQLLESNDAKIPEKLV
ncbi:CvpA family protein [Bacteroidota bacterium]|nr:CvpA family protein [Bacteroidota bacterium]